MIIKNRIFNNTRKGKLKKISLKNNKLKFGFVGLKAIQSGIINLKQLNTLKNIILKKTKNRVKFWYKLNNYYRISKKPINIKMGKGSGKISFFATKIVAGTILLELCSINTKVLINILQFCKFKLPIKTKIVT